MWIFLSDAFFSVVEDRNNPDRLLVRARAPDDISRVFQGVEVTECDQCDYRWRAFVDRDFVARTLAGEVMGLRYDNFKNSVSEPDRLRAYSRVWGDLYAMQLEHQEVKG